MPSHASDQIPIVSCVQDQAEALTIVPIAMSSHRRVGRPLQNLFITRT